jgi:hypothetical protein
MMVASLICLLKPWWGLVVEPGAALPSWLMRPLDVSTVTRLVCILSGLGKHSATF